MTLEERFWSKVDKSGDCWLWTGRRSPFGYGLLSDGHRNVRAQRLSMELAGHTVPPDQAVMHLCDNPPCVRPDHLRIGTQGDNVRDMFAKGRNRSVGKSYRTACPSGHPYDESNTLIRSGRRVCRTCELAREKRRAIARLSSDHDAEFDRPVLEEDPAPTWKGGLLGTDHG